VLVADLPYALEVAFRRRDRPGRVLDGLEDQRGDGLRTFVPGDRVDLVGALKRAAGLLGAVGTAVAVRGRDAQAAGQQRLELRTQGRAPVDGQGSQSRPVVGAPASDELVAGRLAAEAVVLPGNLERGLDGL
jgi:hypothetical protein